MLASLSITLQALLQYSSCLPESRCLSSSWNLRIRNLFASPFVQFLTFIESVSTCFEIPPKGAPNNQSIFSSLTLKALQFGINFTGIPPPLFSCLSTYVGYPPHYRGFAKYPSLLSSDPPPPPAFPGLSKVEPLKLFDKKSLII